MSQAYQEALAWAKRELPEEFAPFAASAAMSLQHLSRPVTKDAVLERLKDQRRDAESLAKAAS